MLNFTNNSFVELSFSMGEDSFNHIIDGFGCPEISQYSFKSSPKIISIGTCVSLSVFGGTI